MASLISKNQFSFVENRNVSDNVLLAQELVKRYGRESLSTGCVMKIDLRKAFDSVN